QSLPKLAAATFAGTPLALLIGAVLLLAQRFPLVLGNVHAADGGDAQRLAVLELHPEPPGKVVGGPAPSGSLALDIVDDGIDLVVGERATELGDAPVLERPAQVRGLRVIPTPCQQPTVQVISVGGTDVSGMSLDLSTASRGEVEASAIFALATTLRRGILVAFMRRIIYSLHCTSFENCLGLEAEAFFCLAGRSLVKRRACIDCAVYGQARQRRHAGRKQSVQDRAPKNCPSTATV